MPSEELDPLLLEILVCPQDKEGLLYFPEDGFLYNPRLKRKYPIKDGIPVMLVDEAVAATEDEHKELMQKNQKP